MEESSDFVERFVVEYLKDLNGTQAAIRAGSRAKYPNQQAYRLLAREDVQERIAKAHVERNARTKIEADTVLREVYAIAFADPNEIVQVRRGCCRHCYGTEHRYQYVDEHELNRARNAFELSEEGLVESFTHGGVGFDAKREPAADCPQCGGEGSAYVHVNDTRNLSPAARALFAGAKQTKDGIEVKLHDKGKHLDSLMRHLGLFKDSLELKGDLGERILRARKRVRG